MPHSWPNRTSLAFRGVRGRLRRGVGLVLAQRHDTQERVILYGSRKLPKTEQNYAAYHRECAGIIWAVHHCRPYLIGQPFTIVTDHYALKWLRQKKDLYGKLGRYFATPAEY